MSTAKDIQWYGKIQSASGIVFSTFLIMHLTNHAMSIMGVFGGGMNTHTAFLNTIRKYYRNPIMELGLLLSFVVHMLCALVKIYYRPKLAPKWLDPSGTLYKVGGFILSFAGKVVPWSGDGSRKIHRIIGYILGVIMVGHIMVFRIIPQVVLGYSNINSIDGRIVTAHIKEQPQIFVPYVLILWTAGAYHMYYGLYVSYQRLFNPKLNMISNGTWYKIGLFFFIYCWIDCCMYWWLCISNRCSMGTIQTSFRI
eukprot:839996_1